MLLKTISITNKYHTMKLKIFTLLSAVFITVNAFGQAPTFHSFTELTIDSTELNLSQYYGKKVMVVNTASYCAYTPQFTQLEQLYTDYAQYGFEIIGFPCNDFGNQDPHNDSTINEFCNTYNVTFQMMSKIHTVTGDTADVYKWLQRADLNGVEDASVTWNFNKFLIDEAGHWVRHFTSPVSPLDTAITNWIMSPSVIQTGVNEIANNSVINIYPNPSAGQFNIQSSEKLSGIKIVNTLGQQVYSEAITSTIATVDLSAHSQGIYFYTLLNNAGVVKTGKLVVK